MEMTQEWINQFNKKCAEFVGEETTTYFIETQMDLIGSNALQFHSDWNWIMEVVCFIKQKVGNPKSLVLASFNGDINKALMTAKKEAVIQAIDQFIDWYDKQKQHEHTSKF